MSRYAAAHAEPQGPGDARPTALQIVKDEGMVGNLKVKTIVISGTSSGIGIETVRALAATGATLYLTARDIAKAKTVLAGILDPDRMELVEMDQGSLESVRTAAGTILEKTNRVNILINNAGIMAVPNLQLTRDGHELQFGTNHLSHFLFFQLLKPALLAAATAEFQSRVVIVASSAHRASGINASDNYDFQKGGYNPWVAYAQSKTANVYMANEIERRYGSARIHSTSLHPGSINTDLKKYIPLAQLEAAFADPVTAKLMKSPEQGAATTIWAAIGKEWEGKEGKGGMYLSDCTTAQRGADDGNISSSSYVGHTYDAKSEKKLWDDSMNLVGFLENA